MRQIVIASDRINELDSFLKGEDIKSEYFYILVDLGCTDTANLLKEKGFKKVSISEGLGSINFKKEYIDFIGRLNSQYNSTYWWANSISYKGNFVSDLCQEIYYYYCIVGLIKNYNRNYIIINNNATLNNCIEKYCKTNSIQFRLVGAKKKENAFTFIKRSFWNSIYFLYQGWTRKFIVSICLSKKINKELKEGRSYYVLKSWLNERSFSNGKYNDLFFGRLPEYLSQNSKDFFILAGILTDYKEVISKIKEITELSIIPQEYFVNYLDYLRALMLAWLNRVRIRKPAVFCGLDVTDFLKRCLKKDYEAGEVNKNLMFFYYAKGLSKTAKVDAFIFTFENQAWERISILALKRYSSGAGLVGYAHSSITQSPLGYFFSKEEEDVMPLPDKIVTSGREPWLILNSSGNYKNRVNLAEGCALRYEYLFEKEKMPRKRGGNILVAFSINSRYSLKLLNFLHDSLGGIDKYKIILRSHPFMPIDLIMKERHLSLDTNFSISENSRFEDDLKDASLFIYIDTTSSIEALMLGIPVVHIDFKEPTSPDPLFKLNSLKFTVSAEKDKLCDSIENI